MASAPRRSTKSFAAAKDILPIVLTPNTRTWIVGPNYSLAEKEFRYVHEDLVLKRNEIGLPKPKICQTNARSGQLYIRFPWGATVEGKSADNPESLLGEAVDAVIYSEAAQLPRQIRERYVQPTVITRKGIEIIPTTPDQGGEWVHELVEAGERGDFPDIESFHWDVTANPLYDREEFERAKKFYGEDSPVFREQYLGEWVFYGGRVYEPFNENIHVIEPFAIPESWPLVVGIDFGHRDPFVALFARVGPNYELYFVDEYYQREGKSIREHAINIKSRIGKAPRYTVVADPESSQSIEDLCTEKIPTIAANNDRQAGRLRVLEYMTLSEDGVPPFSIQNLPAAVHRSRWPRMYVFKTCREMTREIRYFRWKEAINRQGDKEKTEGEDHAMDAMRYVVMTRPSPYKLAPKTPANSFQGWMNKFKKDKLSSFYVGA